jgi:CheY-like chemotaxis protein
VALTAYTGEDWKVKCMEAGFDSFYSKPIIPDELVKLINGLANQ